MLQSFLEKIKIMQTLKGLKYKASRDGMQVHFILYQPYTSLFFVEFQIFCPMCDIPTFILHPAIKDFYHPRSFLLKLTALAAIKCYHCSDFPGHEKSNPCKSEHGESISCDDELFDRCATLTGTIPLPDNDDDKEEEDEHGHAHDEPAAKEVKYRNCTSSLGCNQGSSLNISLFNSK